MPTTYKEKELNNKEPPQILLDYFEAKWAEHDEKKSTEDQEQSAADTASRYNPLASVAEHIVEKVFFAIKLRLFSRMAGIDVLYDQIRILAQSREPVVARLKKLSELLHQHVDIVPENYRHLLRMSIELTTLTLSLYQLATTTHPDIISAIYSWVDRVESLLSLHIVINHVPGEELDKIRGLTLQARKVAHSLNIYQYLPSTASWDEWLQILIDQAVLPQPVQQWLSQFSALSKTLQGLKEEFNTFNEQYPFPEEGDWTMHLDWLNKAMSDPKRAKQLQSYLPSEFTSAINLSIPLVYLARHFPVDGGLGKQINWIEQQISTPSPQLHQLMAQPAIDEIITSIRQQLNEKMAHPALFNALLELADPNRSLWSKTTNIASLFFTRNYLGVAISKALRFGINRLPGGSLILGIWDWYQELPQGITWQDKLQLFTFELSELIQNNPEHLRNLLPENILRSVGALSSLLNLPIGKSWHEILQWASKKMRREAEYSWLYQRYIELSLAQGLYETLKQGNASQQESLLRKLADDLKHYLELRPGSELWELLGLLPYLPLLSIIREEMTNMPPGKSLFARFTNLLMVIEQHPHPALIEFKEVLESHVANYLSDSLMVGMDIIWSGMPSFNFPAASASSLPESERTTLFEPRKLIKRRTAKARKNHALSTNQGIYIESAGITAMWIGILYFLHKNIGYRKNIPLEKANNIQSESGYQSENLLPKKTSIPQEQTGDYLRRIFWPALVTTVGSGVTAWWVYQNFVKTPDDPKLSDRIDDKEITPAKVIALDDFFNLLERNTSGGDRDMLPHIKYKLSANIQPRHKRHVEKNEQKALHTQEGGDLPNDVLDFFNVYWRATEGYIKNTDNIDFTYNSETNLYDYPDGNAIRIGLRYWSVNIDGVLKNKSRKITLINLENKQKIPLTLTHDNVFSLDQENNDVMEMNQFLTDLLSWGEYSVEFERHVKNIIKALFFTIFEKSEKLTLKGLKIHLIRELESILLKLSVKKVSYGVMCLKAIFELKKKCSQGDVIGDVSTVTENNNLGDGIGKLLSAMNVNYVNEDIYTDVILSSFYDKVSYIEKGKKIKLDLENNRSHQKNHKKIIDDYTRKINSMKEPYRPPQDEKFIERYKFELPFIISDERALVERLELFSAFEAENIALYESYFSGVKDVYHELKENFPEIIESTGRIRDINKANMLYFDYVGLSLLATKEFDSRSNVITKEDLDSISASKKFLFDLINQQSIADILAEKITDDFTDIIFYDDYRDIIAVSECADEILTDVFYREELKAYQGANVQAFNEQCRVIMSAMLYYVNKEMKSVDKLNYVPIHEMLGIFLTASEKLNLFNNPMPEGYYTISDFKGREYYENQSYYNEQFNQYKDKYLDYDVREFVRNIIIKNAISVDTLLSDFQRYYYYTVEYGEFNDKYNAVMTTSENNHSGYLIIIQLANDDWLLIANIDNNFNSKKYTKEELKGEEVLNDLIRPQSSLGAYNWMSDNGFSMISKDIYYPYGIKKFVDDEEKRSKRNLFLFFWEGIVGEGGYIPILRFEPLMKYHEKSTFNLITSLMKDSFNKLNSLKKEGLDVKGGWQTFSEIMIPFYKIIYQSATDRYYSPSHEDISSIIIDTVNLLTMVVSLGISTVRLTKEMVERIAGNMIYYRQLGYGREIAKKIVISEIPTLLKADFIPSMLGEIALTVVDFIDPLPIPTRQIVKSLYKGFRVNTEGNPIVFARDDMHEIIDMSAKINNKKSFSDSKLGINANDIISTEKEVFIINSESEMQRLFALTKEDSAVRSIDFKAGDYTVDTGFNVVPIREQATADISSLSGDAMSKSLGLMEKESEKILEEISKYSGSDRAHLKERIQFIRDTTKNAMDEINNPKINSINEVISNYVLIREQDKLENGVQPIYGFISFGYNKEDTLSVRYVVEHPYNVISDSDGFMNFLVNNKFVSEGVLLAYKLKSISSHLIHDGLEKSLAFYGAQNSIVKFFKTTASTAVTNNMDTVFHKKVIDIFPNNEEEIRYINNVERKLIGAMAAKQEEIRNEIISLVDEKNPLRARIHDFIKSPNAKCDSAAKYVVSVLESKGFKIDILGILMYKSMSDNTPLNHYAVVASKKDTEFVIDITLGQFNSARSHGDKIIVESFDDWSEIFKKTDKLKNKIILYKRYPTVLEASKEVDQMGDLPWLSNMPINNLNFHAMQIPEYQIPMFNTVYKESVKLFSHKRTYEIFHNAKNELTKRENDHRMMLREDKKLTDKGKDMSETTQREKGLRETILNRYNEDAALITKINNIIYLSKINKKISTKDAYFTTPKDRQLFLKSTDASVKHNLLIDGFDVLDENGIVAKNNDYYLSSGKDGIAIKNYNKDLKTGSITINNISTNVRFKENKWIIDEGIGENIIIIAHNYNATKLLQE